MKIKILALCSLAAFNINYCMNGKVAPTQESDAPPMWVNSYIGSQAAIASAALKLKYPLPSPTQTPQKKID